MKTLLTLFFCISISAVFAQGISTAKSSDYQVTFEKFSPPTKDLIRQYEENPVTPFIAPDILGKEHYNKDYDGKVLLLWFWNKDCGRCIDMLPQLSKLHTEYLDLNIVSFADDQKADLLKMVEQYDISFPIIPNAKIFAEGAYAGDLGYPRLFIIDTFGIIKHVVPQEAFEAGFDPYEDLRNIVRQYIPSR